MDNTFKIWISVFALLLALVSEGRGALPEVRNILVLHSFHKGHAWNGGISQGIDAVLSGEQASGMDLRIRYEYMDVERGPDQAYILSLYEFFRRKYRGSRFHVIIATDDSAFRFLMAYKKHLFPDTPVVFCGVNYFEEFEMFGHEGYTGVVERIDIRETVEIALRLHPGTRELLVVADGTDTGIATIKTLVRNFRYFRDPEIFRFVGARTFVELGKELSALSPGTVVLFVNFTVDREGNKIPMGEGFKRITADCPVPIYSFWDSYLGSGVLGGSMAGGSAHGKKAAEMALRILKGEPVSTIPVFEASLNRYMFDFNEMKRFGITRKHLPGGARIINVPFSFYHAYKRLVWTVVGGICGLSLIILVLLLNTFKRKRVEKSLKYFSRQLNLLHKIDRAILAGEFSGKLTREVLRHVRDLTDSDWACVVVFDFGKNAATVLAVDSQRGAGMGTGEGAVLPMADFDAELLGKGTRITVDSLDTPGNALFSEVLPEGKPARFTSIPLLSKGELIGTLNLSAGGGPAPRNREMDVLDEVAASLAVAIQSVRLQRAGKRHERELARLSAKVFEMQEATCRKISFELHDEIGQALTATGINLAAIERLIPEGVDGRIAELLGDTGDIVGRLSEQAHDLSLNLWPPMLRDFGLEPTLRWYLGRITEGVDIRLMFDGEGLSERPVEEIETTLYRLVQEALNNVLKHSGATRVDISVGRPGGGMIHLMVEDNGTGFDLEETLADEKMNDRLGILGMRERIAILGGELKIWSTPHRGTCISAEIPWRERR